MKKASLISMVLILLFVSLCGCGKNTDSSTEVNTTKEVLTSEKTKEPTETDYINVTVPVFEVDKYSVDYERIEFPIEFEADVLELIKPVKTDEEAKSVAIDILENHHKQGKWLDDTLVGILHSTEDNVWRFVYSLDQSDVPVDELIECSCAYVVIDGNSGELIAAWAVE